MSNDLVEKIVAKGPSSYNLSSLFTTLIFSNALLIKKIDDNSLNSSLLINENNINNIIQVNQTIISIWILVIFSFIFFCFVLFGFVFLANVKINQKKVKYKILKLLSFFNI